MSDYISREDVLNVDVGLMAVPDDCTEEQKILSQIIDTAILTFKRYVEKLPAADVPERKHGQWIRSVNELGEAWMCSECLEEFFPADGMDEFISYVHYCPNCGARMDSDS